MKREDALILSKVYEIEKQQNRDIYTGDIVNAQVLPKSKCQIKLEEFRDQGFLTETVSHGANMYHVNRKGLSQMLAYRDIKRNVEHFEAVV